MSVVSAATPVLAVEMTEITETTEAPSITSDTTEAEGSGTATDEPEILNEMVEWRTESTKYFRNSDGSYTAAQYAYPVHYKENGEWKEIDNTLREEAITISATDSEKAFVAKNTNTPASFPESLSEDGSNEISVTADGYKISFSPKKNQKELKESKGKVKDREDLDSVKIVDIANEKQDVSAFKLKPNTEKSDEKAHEKNEKFKVENKSGAIVYENVYDNVDLEYELNNSKLKESIVLNEKQNEYVFSFDMDLGGLYPVICEDGSINLCSDNSGETPVAKIEAPYMLDSDGEYSNAVTMTMAQNKTSYVLTVTADKNWLNDNDRAFPVIIDPTIKLDIDSEKTYDCYVDDSSPNTALPYDSWLYVGNNTNGKTRTFVKFDLPDLPDDNCIITNAQIVYYQYEIDPGTGTEEYMTIHKVTEDWDNENYNVTWNNQPNFDTDLVLDYAEFGDSDDNTLYPYQFDITRTVKEWYEGAANYGLAIKLKDETATKRSRMVSAEHSVDNYYPAIYVDFRNNKGLEGYWNYSSFGVGVAGTAHINDYTGNLVYELPILSSISEIMPVSVVGYYNNYCANKLIGEKDPEPEETEEQRIGSVRTSIGRGFRLNYQQTVLPSSEYGLTGTNATKYPYVYTDGDGTEHYIQKIIENEGEDDEKTVYKDEDGLGLTLETGVNDNDEVYYKITDKAHNTYYFNLRGNLSRIKDTNGNELQIIYKEAASKSDLPDRARIDKIIDGAGHTYTFTYYVKSSTGVELDYVKKITDDANRSVVFDISGGLLNEVTYHTGDIATFDYNISSGNSTEGRINAVYSNGIYELNFDYTSQKTGRRVKTVKEYGEETEKGQVITFDRTKYNTTIMRSCGMDGAHGNNDDIITTVQYDNMGRAISQQMKFGSGDEIGAGSVAYTTSVSDDSASGFKNKVSGSGATGKYVENLLYNGNAESDSYWSFDTAGKVDADPDISTASKYIGKKSLKLIIKEVEAEDGRCYYRQNYTDNIKKNTDYTLSAYVKTGDLEAKTDDDLTGAFIQIIGYDSNGDAVSTVNSRSQILTERTDLNVNNGWRRLNCTVNTGEDVVSLRCYLFLRNTKGSVCFDGIQLEKGAAVNDYNMLENSHFTMADGTEPNSWDGTSQFVFSTGASVSNGVASTSGTSGNTTNAVKITGSPGVEKGVTQTVVVEGNADDTYILSGWAKGYPINSTFHKDSNDKENATFEIAVKVKYSASDGSSPEQFKTPASFNTTITDWQCASVPISLRYTDGEDGVTYTPQSIKIIPRYHNQENFVFFDKIMLVKDVASSYTYDKDGNLISAASNSEQKANMKYEDNNLTSYTDSAGFKTELTYDVKNNINYTRSAKGVYTNYEYDDNGNVTSADIRNKGQIAEATAVIKTDSAYYQGKTSGGVTINDGAYKTQDSDENGNLTSYTRDHKTGTVKTVTNAKGVETNYTYYGTFGRQESVTTGGSKVVYDYNSNKQLEKITFGSSGSLDEDEPDYNTLSAPLEEYSFDYDAFGNVTKTMVGTQPLSTNYYKEFNGALWKTEYGNGDYRRYSYNKFGQKMVDYVSDDDTEKKAYSWAYNDSGVNIRHTDYVNGLQYLFDFDSLGRLSKEEAKDYNTGAFVGYTEYGYDVRNNLTKLITNYGGKANKQQYFYTQVEESNNSVDYQKDNLPTMYKLNDGVHALYRYDGINRLNQRKLVLSDNNILYYNYIFKSSDRNAENETKYRTNQVEEEYIGNDVYIYGYDVLGNITSIKKAERKSTNYDSDDFKEFVNETDYLEYTYDSLNQLQCELDYSDEFVNKYTDYTYDELGNITKKWSYTRNKEKFRDVLDTKIVEYSYYVDPDSDGDGNAEAGWNNLLTSVTTTEFDENGEALPETTQTIDYDEIGNPTTYLGAILKWNGRQLTTYAKNNTIITYTYDSNGLRTSKTIEKYDTFSMSGLEIPYVTEKTVTKYYYVNGNLHYQHSVTTDNYDVQLSEEMLYFYYDSNGHLTGLEHNDTVYYPATNLKGDVVAIYNSLGECIVRYEYDAWGNNIDVTDGNSVAITDQNHIAHINPIRYRSYYYDTETEFYYLQSRYYNPEVGRFLNADDRLSDNNSLLELNLFAYCVNNPIAYSDPTGHSIIAGVLTGLGAVIGMGKVLGALKAAATVIGLLGVGTVAGLATIDVSNALQQRSQAKEQAATKADAKIKETVKPDSKDRYWKATKSGGIVDITDPISFDEAVTEVASGGNVFTVTSAEAYTVAFVAGGDAEPMWHKKKNKTNYYDHYHIENHNNGAHVWYLF